MIEVRESEERDVEGIRALFQAEYGTDYCYPQYYDLQLLKKMVFSDNTIMLVAEDTQTKEIVGTASVVLDVGAHADLVGEFGRLVVHPNHRKRGIGKLLMNGRMERVRDRLHIGVVENRVVHEFSQRISLAQNFSFTGLCPIKLQMGKHRETVAVYTRHFGDALQLRRNHPRVVPEVFELAEMALSNCNIPPDAILDEEAPAYPYSFDFELTPFEQACYPALLRLGRGRIAKREIFGPVQLHYGLAKLREHHSSYLIARHQNSVVGGIGFSIDKIERTCKVTELVSLDDKIVRFLLSQLERKCENEWDIDYLEANVSAYAPSMQRTLLEIGFVPCAYVPAHVFHKVERLDSIRMVRLFSELPSDEPCGPEKMKKQARSLLQRFQKREILPEIQKVLPGLHLFSGLNGEQIHTVAALFDYQKQPPDAVIFEQSQAAKNLWIVLEGEVEVLRKGNKIGAIQTGECAGETAFLTRNAHSATAKCLSEVELGFLEFEQIERLIRRRPDIGVALYRNLSRGLSDKLSRI